MPEGQDKRGDVDEDPLVLGDAASSVCVRGKVEEAPCSVVCLVPIPPSWLLAVATPPCSSNYAQSHVPSSFAFFVPPTLERFADSYGFIRLCGNIIQTKKKQNTATVKTTALQPLPASLKISIYIFFQPEKTASRGRSVSVLLALVPRPRLMQGFCLERKYG